MADHCKPTYMYITEPFALCFLYRDDGIHDMMSVGRHEGVCTV